MGSWSAATLKALHHPSLKDRVVIITGGGRGFGWMIAEELLKAGAKVTLTAARHPEELSDVKKQAEAIAGPNRCLTVRADVTKWEDCVATVDATLQAYGTVDVLINNAGRGTSEYRIGGVGGGGERTLFYDVSPEAFRTIIETNVVGVFHMSKAAMPHFLKQGRGKMFAISTSLTTMSSPGLSPYGASKAALEMTHRIWAQELKDKKVDVNILLPGGASDTPFITQAMVPGKVGERAKPGSSLLPGDVIVPPAVWLCSDATNGMTGQRIIAKFWPEGVPPEEALKKCLQPHNELPGIM
jgi:3-oxoacyl-[acyl-carrier protein] reductase